jgi:hypothetical protein
MNDLAIQKEFENEVRRIARELWPSAQYGGAETINGQQRDGVFSTEDVTHLMECTVSRGHDKAFEDANKLAKLTEGHYTDQTVWLPVRSAEKRQRVMGIVDAPHDSTDSLVRYCAALA